MRNAVCFSGYRPDKYDFSSENRRRIFQKLVIEIINCAKYGYDTFYFGGAPGFDLLAAHAVIYCKKVFDIKLICALPYADFSQSCDFTPEWQIDYKKAIYRCDNVVNVSGLDYNHANCYMERNRFMVNSSSMLICFHDGKLGGTLNTIQYAQQKGLRIINLLSL